MHVEMHIDIQIRASTLKVLVCCSRVTATNSNCWFPTFAEILFERTNLKKYLTYIKLEVQAHRPPPQPPPWAEGTPTRGPGAHACRGRRADGDAAADDDDAAHDDGDGGPTI